MWFRSRLRRWLALTGCATMLAALASSFALTPSQADPVVKPFTLVMIPDTQLAVQNKPELFYAQTEWILQERKRANIRFVVHVGDVVEWPSRISDWERAKMAMQPLDRKVPYQLAVGNHDFDAWACEPPATCNPWEHIEEDRSTTYFNTYFPLSLFEEWPTFGGNYPREQSDNTYFEFRAGGIDWLVITVAFNPTDAELAWAERVIAKHRNQLVIVNTHEYQDGDVRTPTGDRIWNVLKKYPNVRFVFSGHYVNQGMRVDLGDHGNPVYQIQADYQTYSIPDVNENGYLRVMKVDPAARTMSVQTYSPYCDKTGECPAYKTDTRNQFTITDLDLRTWRR